MQSINTADSGPFQASIQGESDTLKTRAMESHQMCQEQSQGPSVDEGEAACSTKDRLPYMGGQRRPAGLLGKSIHSGQVNSATTLGLIRLRRGQGSWGVWGPSSIQ